MNDIPEDEYDLGYLDAKISRLCTRIVEKDAEIERLRRQVSLLNGHDTLAQFQAHIDEQAAEIERLKAALRWYAEAEYNGHNGGPEAARRALEGKDG